MSVVPLARYLIDFGSGSDAGKSLAEIERVRALVEKEAAARIAESHARGFEEGRAFGEEQLVDRLSAQHQEHMHQLEAERQAWAAKEGEVLAELLAAGLREIEARTASTVARVLERFVNAQVREAAVAELMALLQAVLSKGEAAKLEVSGPQDLLAVIQDRLAGQLGAARFATREGPDVRIEIDHTIIETRLSAWAETLAEAVR